MFKKKFNKGQIRMTETIAILFIFFLLIIFALIFYGRYQKIAFQEKQELDFSNKAIEITTKVLFLPELKCTVGESEPEDYCFDMLKLRHIKDISDIYLEDYYFDLFSYSKIVVHEIYPSGLWENDVDLDNPPPLSGSSWKIYENVPCPVGCEWDGSNKKCKLSDDHNINNPVSCKVYPKSTFFTVALRDETDSVLPGNLIYKTGLLEVQIFR